MIKLKPLASALIFFLSNLAFADVSKCYEIKDPNMKQTCIAIDKNDKLYCFNIKFNDQKYFCLAIIEQQKSRCYSVINKDLKNQCLSNF